MKRFLVFLTAILLFVGCSTEPPDPDATDWCYIYDFTNGFTEFSIAHGTILNLLGIIPDSSNVISFSYEYDRFVEPLYVIPTIARAPSISGDITIDAAGVVYGLSTSGQAVLPAALDTASPTFEQTEIGIAGNSINVTIQSSQAVVFRKLEIRGMGSNPFPRNDCDKSPYQPSEEPTIGTPSPIPTLTPSLTASTVPSATSTQTPSETFTPTPTPTNTPSGLWTCTFDFTVAENGFAVAAPFGSWSGGTGYLTADENDGIAAYTRSAQIVKTMPTTAMTRLTIVFDLTKGHFTAATPVMVIYINGSPVASVLPDDITDGTDKTFTWEGSSTPTTVGFWGVASYDNASPSYDGAITLKSAVISGDGGNPFTPTSGLSCDEPTPTPSPTPTASETPNDATNTAEAMTATASSATPTAVVTATQTLTPSDGYFCSYNFLDNNGGFSATNGSFDESGDGWLGGTVGGSNVLQINKTIGSTQINSITLTWIVEIPAATLIISSPYGTASSINVTGGTRIQTYTAVRTGVTSLAFSGGGSAVTGKRLRLTRAEIRGSGTRPTGASCQNPTPTPVMSRTPVSSSTPRPATRTPIPPPPQFVTPTFITATPGGPTLTPDGTLTALPGTATALAGTPSNQIAEGIGSGSGVGSGQGDLYNNWLGQIGFKGGEMINSFLDTPPQPIPGLPLCMSNPQGSDWCAIIYILEYTILAPGTPGELIIPMLQIMINVYIVIYFIRWVLKIVRRGESMTNVS